MRAACWLISIHSPRMGRDGSRPGRPSGRPYFNPLSPHGERREWNQAAYADQKISIHSPRMGRDTLTINLPAGNYHFNPLSPHGERQAPAGAVPDHPLISIHSPRMGRDLTIPILFILHISIHSPRMGRDSKRTQLFEEKNWRICTTLYLFASKEVLPADKKTF